MIKKYRKRPVEIEALRWTGKNQVEMFDFLTNDSKDTMTSEEDTFRIDFVNGGCQTGNLIIKTKEGEMKADVGDYVIKEPFSTDDRKFYPCKPDIFEKTYEDAEVKEYINKYKEVFRNMSKEDILKTEKLLGEYDFSIDKYDTNPSHAHIIEIPK